MTWQDNVVEKCDEPICMWEILVPTEKRVKTPAPEDCGDPEDYAEMLELWHRKNSYTTRFHRTWDKRVRDITGGLTVLQPAKGQWISPTGELYQERMIPVRIAATRTQIDQIIDMTLAHYDQLAVLCYKVSDLVIIRHKEQA